MLLCFFEVIFFGDFVRSVLGHCKGVVVYNVIFFVVCTVYVMRSLFITEDDPAISDLLSAYAQSNGFSPQVFDSAEVLIEEVQYNTPAAILLDIGLAGNLDGIEACRAIRAFSDVPILLVTARDSEIDRVLALELGADDYINKPFSPREVMARVKTVLRRSEGVTVPKSLTFGSISVDSNRREVFYEGNLVEIPKREYDLLVYFLANSMRVIERQSILDNVWGENWVGDERTIDVHVRHLRKRFPALSFRTVRGVGYMLEGPNDS